MYISPDCSLPTVQSPYSGQGCSVPKMPILISLWSALSRAQADWWTPDWDGAIRFLSWSCNSGPILNSCKECRGIMWIYLSSLHDRGRLGESLWCVSWGVFFIGSQVCSLRHWALSGLYLVTYSVCDFHGQNLKVQLRDGESSLVTSGSLLFADEVVLLADHPS